MATDRGLDVVDPHSDGIYNAVAQGIALGLFVRQVDRNAIDVRRMG